MMKSIATLLAFFFIHACQKDIDNQKASPLATPKNNEEVVKSEKAEVIVYVSELGNRADVFDLRVGSYTLRSKDNAIAGKLDTPTDLGTSLRFCHTNNVACLESGLVVAVSHDRPLPMSWESDHISCYQVKVDRTLNATEIGARCTYGRSKDRHTVFVIDLRKGITWYRRECPECDNETFVLHSPTGLFGGL